MTLAEMKSHVGKRALLRCPSDPLLFPVKIRGAKNAYGNYRYLVAPIRGVGETWVDASRVTLPAKVPPDDVDGSAPK